MAKRFFLFCAFITTICVFFVFFYVNKEVNCVGNVTFVKGNEKLSLVVENRMLNGDGVLIQSGTLYLDNKNPLTVSQIIHFKYRQNSGVIIAKSVSIQNSPRNEISYEEEQNWLPDFFVKVGGELTWIVHRISANSWFFHSNTVPLYICEGRWLNRLAPGGFNY